MLLERGENRLRRIRWEGNEVLRVLEREVLGESRAAVHTAALLAAWGDYAVQTVAGEIATQMRDAAARGDTVGMRGRTLRLDWREEAMGEGRQITLTAALRVGNRLLESGELTMLWDQTGSFQIPLGQKKDTRRKKKLQKKIGYGMMEVQTQKGGR